MIGRGRDNRMGWLRRTFELPLETMREFNRDGGSMLSAGITYYALFSVAPLFFVAVSVAGLITQGLRIEDNLQAELERVLGGELAQIVAILPAKTSSSRFTGWAATLLGIGVIVYAAVRLFFRLQQVLDFMWGVRFGPRPSWRDYLRSRLPVLAIVVLLGVALAALMVASLVISLFAGALDRWLPAGLQEMVGVANPVLVIVAGWLVFTVMFKVLPDVKVSIRDVWLGALFTTLGWAVAVALFRLYLSLGGGSAYQAAGAIVVFLVLVHYLSYIFVFGAKLTCVMVRRRGRPVTPSSWSTLIVTIDDEQVVAGPEKAGEVGPPPTLS
jgi:membrane protein